jgi:hypothetical protein
MMFLINIRVLRSLKWASCEVSRGNVRSFLSSMPMFFDINIYFSFSQGNHLSRHIETSLKLCTLINATYWVIIMRGILVAIKYWISCVNQFWKCMHVVIILACSLPYFNYLRNSKTCSTIYWAWSTRIFIAGIYPK